MMKSVIMSSLRITALLLFFYNTTGVAVDYVWGKGGTTKVKGPLTITSSDTLTINEGVITLQDEIIIQTDSDINVNGKAVIKSQDKPKSGRLHFNAFEQVTKLIVHENLEFNGADDGTALLITTEDHNTTQFVIADGKKVSFTKGAKSNSGSTNYFVLMAPNTGVTTQLLFSREEQTDEDVKVVVGAGSSLGYLSSNKLANDDAIGSIAFDPSNFSTGRMILEVKDQANVLISPVCSSVASLPKNSNINFKNTAGGRAFFEVVGQGLGQTAGLLVLNLNQTFGELLVDPFLNLCARNDSTKHKGKFSGNRDGFILGNNGVLFVQNGAYVDYVGLANNACPAINGAVLKSRNPSAFIVDGSLDPLAKAARIDLGDCSGLFFRSGVDCQGDIASDFVIDSTKHTKGAGEIVFDIEGRLDVHGSNTESDCKKSKLEILSLQVNPAGGLLFIAPNSCPFIFPARTFGTDSQGKLLAYNTSCWLVNNDMNIANATLVHSDVNHKVIEKDDINSEPTYIGGETFTLKKSLATKPEIAFFDANLFVHENIAFTGLDVKVPNRVDPQNICLANTSKFVFFQNGKQCDNGTGRQMILGTLSGSESCVARASCGANCVSRSKACSDSESSEDSDSSSSDSSSDQSSSSSDCPSSSSSSDDSSSSSGSSCSDSLENTTPVVINKDAHLDIVQENECAFFNNNSNNTLVLLSATNDNTIIPPQTCIIDTDQARNQPSIHTVFLGNESNISIGLNQNCDPLSTPLANLLINGNFFSFESRGGQTGKPENASVTGQGGIFVDCNGKIEAGGIQPDACFHTGIGEFLCRVLINMGVMVTKSRNGIVDLPQSRVYFDNKVGISDGAVNLADPAQQTVVAKEDNFSDFTLNWNILKKDYAIFSPFQVTCYDPCNCPAIVEKNVSGIPIIKGVVEQFQIKGSRLGDQAHIKIDGGKIRELIFLKSNLSAQAPVGVVVLENCGSLGIGSTHRNIDSLNASITLGVNGVSIIANGTGQIELNEDIIINNVCHILKGPNFNSLLGAHNVLNIHADCCRTLRVKSGGVLDLSSFKQGDTITLSGDIKLVLEPGSRIVMDGAELKCIDTVQVVAEPTIQEGFCDEYINPNAGTLRSTDGTRVKLHGSGTLTFAGCSQFIIDKGAYVGVETWPGCGITQTAIDIQLIDSAKFSLGNGCLPEGGAFQVGNTENDPQGTVSFELLLNGPKACFEISQQGFFGLGVGIVDKTSNLPNQWLVQTTFNVQNAIINVFNGKFAHNLTYSGDDPHASLFALGASVQNYSFDAFTVVDPDNANVSRSQVLGGGNFVRINPVGPINPTVLGDVVTFGDVLAGIFASKPLLNTSVVSGTADAVWNALRVKDLATEDFPGRATAGPSEIDNFILVGYVDVNKIGRALVADIVGAGGTTTKQEHSLKIGAVFIILDPLFLPPRPIIAVFELP